jgi:hypothetical protein
MFTFLMNDAFLDDDVFFSDERSYGVVVQNVLRESAASRRRSVAHRRQVTVKSVPPVNFQMFRQMIGPGKALLTNGTSEKMIKNKIINNSKIYWVFQWVFF